MGYFFFFVTVLFYFGLAMATASKPNFAGDNGMAEGLLLVFLGFGFTVSSLALTITLLVKGSFHWLVSDAGARGGLVLVSWLCIVLTTFFCAAFKWQWPSDNNTYPTFLHTLAANHGQIWIPLLWLVACFVSLDSGLQQKLPPSLPKYAFYAGLLVSGVYSAGLASGYLRDSAQHAEQVMTERQDREDRWHRQRLDDVAAHQPTDPLGNLLVQTTLMQDADVRAAALAKLKSYPNWEAQVLALLKDRQTYREVYYFLDGNAVDHPEQFAQPLNHSILWLAERIEADIKHSGNLQHWSFDSYGIDRLLRAIDSGPLTQQGVDFYPNIVRVKQALDTTPPEQFEGVTFDITDVVKSWLKRHRK